MNTEALIAQLERNAQVIRVLVGELPAEQASWKPSVEQWSVLEVAAHLLDEEREDFRVRIDYLLHRLGEAWPPIDPQGWVEERSYASRDLGETIAEFLDERARSVAWLRRLVSPESGSPDWGAFLQHPELGTLRAGDLLASWLAHDFLHIRQLTRLQLEYHSRKMEPYETSYASPVPGLQDAG